MAHDTAAVAPPPVRFETHPDRYQHWSLTFDGPIARLNMNVKEEGGLRPGYQQIPWNGLDAEGSSLANGVYFFRLSAESPGAHVEQLGRLVKLRKPRHVDAGTTP